MLRQPNPCRRIAGGKQRPAALYTDAASGKWAAIAGKVVFLLLAQTFDALQAQDDGARTFWPAPVGTQIVSGHYLLSAGNVSAFNPSLPYENVAFDSHVLALSYDHYFQLADRSARVHASFPAGTIEGTAVRAQPGHVDVPAKGMADLTALVALNLTGAPAMSPAAFVTNRQKTVVDVQLFAGIPLGEYNEDRFLNVGANRWVFRLGLPVTQLIGDWIPGRRTTVEFVPSVSIFTRTEGNETSLSIEQDPLFRFEGHVTRDLTSNAWFSVDGIYLQGGGTTRGGVDRDDAQSSLSLGLTAGISVSEELHLTTTWMNTFTDNDDGLNATFIRMRFSYVWNGATAKLARQSSEEDRLRIEDLQARVVELEREHGIGEQADVTEEGLASSPKIDGDRDGIPDLFDSCPDTPTGVVVRLDGCLVKLVLEDIEFEPGSTVMTDPSRDALGQIADSLVSDLTHIGSSRLEIRGYTDSSGDEAANVQLSHRRANVVLDYLVELRPSFERFLDRIFAIGYGEEHPIAPNDTEEGRSQNRRVELVVLEN